MGTINFTFEDLCAFFTSRPSRLMVGMIATDGEAPENVHRPTITVKEGGVVKREYSGFEEVHGDITLDVFPKGRPFSRLAAPVKRDRRHPFDKVVDIERQLYPGEALSPSADACRARLHFRNGELCGRALAVNAKFADARTHRQAEHAPSTVATKVGLDVKVPDHGYAVWHFEGGAEDFVFKGGRDYEVEVANRAPAIDFSHFDYFYNVMRPKPQRRIVPVVAEAPEPTPRFGDWRCMIVRFGRASYPLPKAWAK